MFVSGEFKMMKDKSLSIGEKAIIKKTGQEVTVDQISEHGFAIIKFNTGGKHRLLNQYLEPVEEHSPILRN